MILACCVPIKMFFLQILCFHRNMMNWFGNATTFQYSSCLMRCDSYPHGPSTIPWQLFSTASYGIFGHNFGQADDETDDSTHASLNARQATADADYAVVQQPVRHTNHHMI